MKTPDGRTAPVQSWPLAYWPDGSLKWSGHACGDREGLEDQYQLIPGESQPPEKPVAVAESSDSVIVDTGVIQCRIPKSGSALIESIERGGAVIARNGRLIALRQDQPEASENGATEREQFLGRIEKVAVEQSGPVRVVVKIDGMHVGLKSQREWLPFSVRLYLYAGNDALRIMHSFIYDGVAEEDFICGLGVRFDLPMRNELHNRHVRFVSEDKGVWFEAVSGMTGLRRDPGRDVRQAQVEGRETPPVAEWDKRASSRIGLIPAWNDYKLTQLSADGWELHKRTKPGHAWVRSTGGTRAAGVAYLGGPDGGLAIGQRYFWQRHPAQIDIRGAATENAEATLWLWSPEAPAMDLRFYHDGMGMETHADEIEGLEITYEDYEKGWGDPQGISRTNEIYLWVLPHTPSNDELLAITAAVQTPPMLVCPPQQYLAAEVFGGLWDLPDRSTPGKARIEDQLDFLFSVYQQQIEEERWYGFWDHGDVMHTYDDDRQVWRYDVGGYAWDNSELSTDLWLWYSFLRTGRADIFRVAEAMTRHTGEVDVYHLGRFKGLGTRHNVQHWGCSSKQPRISTAANRRFLYYMTADERIGDLMRELLGSDQRLRDVDVTRKVRNDGDRPYPYPVCMGFGTDWDSLAAAWLTEWERTQNTEYRDRLLNGMRDIGAMPYGWLSGEAGYDPASGRFVEKPDRIQISHLNAVFGAVAINAELLQLLDAPEYEKTWLQYCELYNAPPEVQEKALGRSLGFLNLKEAHSRLTAYAAWKANDAELARRAWVEFYGGQSGLGSHDNFTMQKDGFGQLILNRNREQGGFHISTNAVAQWGLTAIQNLKLIGDFIPEES